MYVYCVYLLCIYTSGRWMLESDWLMSVLRCAVIFRETHSDDRITWLYHFAKLFLLFQRSYNRKITKTHNDTGQTNKYSKQKHKIHRSCPCFCHKIMFYYVRKAHSLLSLSLSLSLGLSLTDAHIVYTHLNISANVVSPTLMIRLCSWRKGT